MKNRLVLTPKAVWDLYQEKEIDCHTAWALMQKWRAAVDWPIPPETDASIIYPAFEPVEEYDFEYDVD